jgi:CRP-like cAMP-binding protein
LNYTEQNEALKRTQIFAALNDDALGEIAKLVNWRGYEKDAKVVSYKDDARDVYFLAEGRVRATIFSASGKEISYQELSPGSMFGELSAIDAKPRTANVITLERSQIGRMHCEDFWNVMGSYPDVAAGVMLRLATLVRFLSDRVYQFGTLDVKDRVRAEVLRMAREATKDDRSAVIDRMPTHVEIANRINTHREAVTRELNELTRLGLIEKDKRTLTVPNLEALAELLPEEI